MISEDAEVRIGLKDSECGAIGVMSVAGTSGETMHPPAEMLYAVDPEGDATISPSPWAVVTSCPSTNTYKKKKKKKNCMRLVDLIG